MPDMSAIATLISSFSAAQNITKGFLDLKSLGEVQAKVIELQSVIMSAQTTALAAQTEHAHSSERVETFGHRHPHAVLAEKVRELDQAFVHADLLSSILARRRRSRNARSRR